MNLLVGRQSLFREIVVGLGLLMRFNLKWGIIRSMLYDHRLQRQGFGFFCSSLLFFFCSVS